MSYAQYRVKIGTTVIKNTMIGPDSYQITKNERVISTWKDANQVEHREMADELKTSISFTIRERSMADHQTIAPIFATLKNLSVEYWDDITGDYATGTFYMDPPTIQTRRHGASLLYMETQVNLTEY